MATTTGRFFRLRKAELSINPGLTAQQNRFYDEMIALDIPWNHPRFDALQRSAEMVAALGTPRARWLAHHNVMRVIGNVDGFGKRHVGVKPRSDPDINDVLSHNFSKFFPGEVFYRLDALDMYAVEEPRVKPIMAQMRSLADRYEIALSGINADVTRRGLGPREGRKQRHQRYQAAWQGMATPLRTLLNSLRALCDR